MKRIQSNDLLKRKWIGFKRSKENNKINQIRYNQYPYDGYSARARNDHVADRIRIRLHQLYQTQAHH